MSDRKATWFENALLLGLLGLLALVYGTLPNKTAQAAGGGWDTNGVMAVTTGPSERLVLIDTTKKNICVYRNLGAGQFRLVGARSYKYDVEIKDSKATEIERGNGVTFHEIKKLYESQPKAP